MSGKRYAEAYFDHTAQIPTCTSLERLLLEWIAAQPYPASGTEFIRDLIDKARELTK